MENNLRQSPGGQFLAAVLIGAIGSSLLFSASLAVPIVGFVSAFIAPVPLGLARIRGGNLAAGISAIIATIITALIFSAPVGAWYAVQCGIIGLLVPEFVLRGYKPSRAILWSSAITLLILTVAFVVFTTSSGKTPQLFIQNEISDSINQATKLYEQQPGLSTGDIENIKQAMNAIGQVMSVTYPALATINIGLISAVTLLLFIRIANRMSLVVEAVKFTEYRVPEKLIWVTIVAGFSMLTKFPVVTTPALNILVVLGVLYFMQGISVLLTICNRTGFSSTLKIVLTVVLLTQPYLAVVVAITGIFDYWGDFRIPKKPQEENL